MSEQLPTDQKRLTSTINKREIEKNKVIWRWGNCEIIWYWCKFINIPHWWVQSCFWPGIGEGSGAQPSIDSTVGSGKTCSSVHNNSSPMWLTRLITVSSIFLLLLHGKQVTSRCWRFSENQPDPAFMICTLLRLCNWAISWKVCVFKTIAVSAVDFRNSKLFCTNFFVSRI